MMPFDLPRILFLTELLAAVILFLSGVRKRSHIILRTAAAVIIMLSVLVFPDYENHFLLGNMYYLYILCLMIVVLYILFKMTVLECITVAVAAYASQHCAYDFLMLTITTAGIDLTREFLSARFFAIEIGVYIVVYSGIYILFGRRVYFMRRQIKKRYSWLLFSIFIIGFVIILNLVAGGSVQDDPLRTLCFIYDIIGTIFGLMVMFYMSRNTNLESELEDMEQMLKMKKEYYELSKENIELVNIRCHDIKQNLDQIYNSGANVLTREMVGRLKKDISVYDAISKTGNEAVDLAVTEKSLYCEQHGIRLTYMVDGKQMNFMDSVDIYVIFGNILQNAIEAVEKIDNRDKRIISLSVKANEKLLIIQAENYFTGTVTMQNGLPLTNKDDKTSHGIGMKSIQILVKKYMGEMNIKTREDRFLLSIVLPIPS